MAPVVTVTLVTYNHEKYVADAIRSVLGQTFADIELVVVNDGSTDGTAARIAAFDDPRLVVIHQDNRGPSAAANRAVAAARGKYVALFTGDDVCHPDRVRRQLAEYARGGRRLLFARCDFIDDDGRPLSGEHFAADVFEYDRRTRAQTLARFFHHGNFLNAVTAFAERDVIAAEPFDPALLQLQDFDVWIRHAKKYDIEVMPDAVLSYRVRSGDGNLSSPTPGRLVRLTNETYLVLRRFFDGIPADLFRKAFACEAVNPDFADGPEFACEQAFAYCRLSMPLGRLIGIERLQALLNDPEAAAVLATKYRFTTRQFFDLLGSVQVAQSYDGDYSTLFLDTGRGWNTDERVCRRVSAWPRDFRVTFDLPAAVAVRALRWDPVELRTCRVRVEAVELRDGAGRTRPVDPSSMHANGTRLPDGTVSFSTSDPLFWWPFDGEVTGVAVRGRWEHDDALTTILKQSEEAHDLRRQLTDARRELRKVYTSPYWVITAPVRAARAMARRLRAG